MYMYDIVPEWNWLIYILFWFCCVYISCQYIELVDVLLESCCAIIAYYIGSFHLFRFNPHIYLKRPEKGGINNIEDHDQNIWLKWRLDKLLKRKAVSVFSIST